MLNRFNFKIILNLWFYFNFARILAFNPSDTLNCSPKEKSWILLTAQLEVFFLKLTKNLES